MILDPPEVIFSIIFHVQITQSALINVKYNVLVYSIYCFAAVGAVNI